MSPNRCRYLDFYFKNENEIRVAFEFDEYRHNNPKSIENDLIREIEIFIKRPGIQLFRIPEDYYDNYFDIMFNDVINLIQDINYETTLNYDCLLKRLK